MLNLTPLMKSCHVCGIGALLSIKHGPRQPFACWVQGFGNFSTVGYFLTPPALGSDETVYVLDTADMGHAEPDGSNEWEDDLNARLYNAPGKFTSVMPKGTSACTVWYDANECRGDSMHASTMRLVSPCLLHVCMVHALFHVTAMNGGTTTV